MSPEIKLTITRNEKLIQTVTKAIESQQLVRSLEEFQVEANAALTKMIEDLAEEGEANWEEIQRVSTVDWEELQRLDAEIQQMDGPPAAWWGFWKLWLIRTLRDLLHRIIGGDTIMDEDDDTDADDDDADSSLSTSEDSKGHSHSKKKKHH